MIQHRNFFILNDLLCYYKEGKERVRGILKLSYVYMFVEDVQEESECEETYRYALRFECRNKFTRIYIRNLKDLQIWKDTISPYVVMTKFHDDYEAVDRLGEGSFGTVFLVKKNDVSRTKFAVKAFSKKDLSRKSDSWKTVSNEINLMRELGPYDQFPGYYGTYETKNSIYLVIDYIQGRPMMDLCDIQIVPEKHRLTMLAQLLDGLEVMEKLGIIHRDLKPDNIMVDQYYNVYIIDLGLSIKFEPGKTYRRAGTPGFIPPELLEKGQSNCTKYSFKTDIYSIGIIQYCMITGIHPFDGEDANEILLNNQQGQLDFDLERIANCSKDEQMALRGMLEFHQSKRAKPKDIIAIMSFDNTQIPDESASRVTSKLINSVPISQKTHFLDAN